MNYRLLPFDAAPPRFLLDVAFFSAGAEATEPAPSSDPESKAERLPKA